MLHDHCQEPLCLALAQIQVMVGASPCGLLGKLDKNVLMNGSTVVTLEKWPGLGWGTSAPGGLGS